MSFAPSAPARDLLVVGGGPAGLATAIFAALAGLTVTLFERRRFPVDKPCGEGLMPRGALLLSEMGLRIEESVPFQGIRYLDRTSVAEARFQEGLGYGIRRTVLSRAMAERARGLGVEIVESTRVDSVESGVDHARVTVGARVFDGRWVVAADGLHSAIRARFSRSLLPGENLRPRRYGYRCRYHVRPWSSFVEVHWSEGGEAYATPVGAEEVAIAFPVA